MTPRARAEARDESDDVLEIRWAPIADTAQQSMWDDLTPEAKLAFFGGYGSGKTYTLVGKGLQLSNINGEEVPGICLVPDYGHFEDTILETVRAEDPDTGARWFLENSQFHYRITRSGTHLFEWEGGGPWHVMSAIRPDSIKGPQRGYLIGDEIGIQSYQSWKNAQSRIRHLRARLRQTAVFGTPEGIGWLETLFGEEHEGSYYRVYRMQTSQNVELLKHQPGYLRQVMENASEQEILSYLGGQAVSFSGQTAYSTFARDVHWREDVPIDERLPLRICFDFNVDPMAVVIAQVGPPWISLVEHRTRRQDIVRVIDAVVKSNTWTEPVCQEIVRRYGRQACRDRFGAAGADGWPGGCIVYGDASGNNRSTQSNKSNYQIIKEILLPEFPSFEIHKTARAKANPPEIHRINSMRAIFRNALGQVGCFVRKTQPARICTTYPLVKSCELTMIPAGEQTIEKKRGEQHTHPSDALGYLVTAEFPVALPSLITSESFASPDHL